MNYALGAGLPTPSKTLTEGLPRLWEAFGRASGSVGRQATAVFGTGQSSKTKPKKKWQNAKKSHG
jgi:hypothetical protein